MSAAEVKLPEPIEATQFWAVMHKWSVDVIDFTFGPPNRTPPLLGFVAPFSSPQ